MTKCLLKALKAVDLQNYIELFQSLGYDSAGALAHFHHEHFKQLNLSSQELLRFHALLDVLKEAMREGKICPHYSKSHQQSTTKSTSMRSKTIQSIQYQNSQLNKSNYFYSNKKSNEDLKSHKSSSSIRTKEHSSVTSLTNKHHAGGFILQRPFSSFIPTYDNQNFSRPRTFSNRPSVQHVKVRRYSI